MRDIEDLLRRTMPNDAALPDVEALHRRGVRRRWTVRVGSATTMVAVVAVGALSLQSITPPIVDGDGAGPTAGQDGAADGDGITAEEREVQACMEDEGLRYDVEPGTESPPAAPTITPSLLAERTDTDTLDNERIVTAVEERGWLGYRQALNEAPTVASLGEEWYGATQEHLWEDWEREAIDRGDAVDSDLEPRGAHGDERAAYVEQLTACQEEAYGIEILDLEQRRLLEQVRGADWTAAKTTGFLAQDERVQRAQRQREECHADLRDGGDLNEVQLNERLDAIAEQTGHRPPESDPGITESRGWGEQQLLDADPDEVDGLREFVEDTREPTLELVDCERTYADAVAEVADERAGEYLGTRADELRDAGIEVDLGPGGEHG